METGKEKLRATKILSTDLDETQMREAVAQALGVHADLLIDSDIMGDLQKTRILAQKVEQVISHLKARLKNENAPNDKIEELQDIGRFIVAANESLELVVPEKFPKHPDFLLHARNYSIGVEHTRLINEDFKATIKTVRYCLKKAQDILTKELGHLSLTVNIFIDYHKNIYGEANFINRLFSRQQKTDLSVLIADFVRSALTNGNIPRPDFIYQLDITPNKDSRLDIELSERYFTRSDISQPLLKAIDQKEKKAENYRSAQEVDLLCLLIVIDDIHSFCGFNLEDANMPTIGQSEFDIILLFERHGFKTYPVYLSASVSKKEFILDFIFRIALGKGLREFLQY